MTTVKIKFCPSAIEGREGTIFYQIIHHRAVRRKKTDYRLYAFEWNHRLSEVVFPETSGPRCRYLQEVGEGIRKDMQLFQRIISGLKDMGRRYTVDDVLMEFESFPSYSKKSLFLFMEEVIAHLKALGKERTSETYTSAFNSFKRFREDRDVMWDDVDSDMMTAYEAYLRNNGVSPNTSSFYMRNIRAVYNRAVEKNLTRQRYPFKYVYTGVAKTVKRAISLATLRQIKDMDLSANPALDFARDMFLFSFYTRGMSFVDMAYLRKKDLNDGILTYRRRKTRQQLFVKWEKCMQEIVDKYDTSQTVYLLPILQPFKETDERRQYIYAGHNVNRALKIIGNRLQLPLSLTMYVSRHSWASIARSKNVSLSVISEGMGHDSETTTRIYLATLDTMAIDNANHMILKCL